MSEEFTNLSEKIWKNLYGYLPTEELDVRDVKTFIQKLKEEMKGQKIGKLHKVISKLAGSKLVNQE